MTSLGFPLTDIQSLQREPKVANPELLPQRLIGKECTGISVDSLTSENIYMRAFPK